MEHGYEFGAGTIDEYEAMADRFMTKPLDARTMKDCLREPYRQVYCRYDLVTQEYGTMYVWGTLITYFKPDQRFTVIQQIWTIFTNAARVDNDV